MADTHSEQLDSVLTTTSRLMSGVVDGQAGDPTPCPDYDVDTLRGHIADSAERFSGGGSSGAGGEPGGVTQRFDRAADRLRTTYAQDPAAGDKRTPVGVVLMEFVIHGWDLARATGQDPAYDDASTEAAIAAGQAMMKPEYRGPGQPFGEEVAVPDDAPPIDRLVALMGRDPAWKP